MRAAATICAFGSIMDDDLLTKYMTPGQKKARIIRRRRAAAGRYMRSRWSEEQRQAEEDRIAVEVEAFIAKRSAAQRSLVRPAVAPPPDPGAVQTLCTAPPQSPPQTMKKRLMATKLDHPIESPRTLSGEFARAIMAAMYNADRSGCGKGGFFLTDADKRRLNWTIRDARAVTKGLRAAGFYVAQDGTWRTADRTPDGGEAFIRLTLNWRTICLLRAIGKTYPVTANENKQAA